jgi:hypothetical protein
MGRRVLWPAICLKYEDAMRESDEKGRTHLLDPVD